MIKNIRVFPNNNVKSLEAAQVICDKFSSRGFRVSDDGYDLAIAVGGDGSFLRMVRENNFDSNIHYVGINLGTLGFAQEVNIDSLDDFISELEIGKFKIEEIGVQETLINYDNKVDSFYSLNEMVLRDKRLGALKFDVKINDDFLERYVGDGILVATSFGSTAQNKSYGGSIVYNELSSLQITPIAPISSKVFRSISNSIIVPSGYDIRFIPFTDRKDMIVTIDGNINVYDNVEEVRTKMDKKKIKYLRFSRYNFAQKLNEKILND